MLPDQPLVSVVVPTHNRAARLPVAVASVQAQTWARVELVVVDDASTDDTPEVLDRLAAADPRLRVVRPERPLGASDARNAGLDAAEGEVVAFLDDDDEWLPDKLERQLALLRDRPDVGLVGCSWEVIRPGGRRRIVHRMPERCTAADLLWDNFVGGASVCLWRRDVLACEPRFDPNLPTGEDWDVWLACAGQAGVASVPEPLCRYVVHDAEHLSTDPALAEGRRRFVTKHRDAMDRDCLAYHQARLALLEGRGAGAVWREVRGSRRAGAAIAAASLGGRLGDLLGDPGRGSRTLHRLVGGRDR